MLVAGQYSYIVECLYSEFAEQNWENVIWKDFKDKINLPDNMIFLGSITKTRAPNDNIRLTFILKIKP